MRKEKKIALKQARRDKAARDQFERGDGYVKPKQAKRDKGVRR